MKEDFTIYGGLHMIFNTGLTHLGSEASICTITILLFIALFRHLSTLQASIYSHLNKIKSLSTDIKENKLFLNNNSIVHIPPSPKRIVDF